MPQVVSKTGLSYENTPYYYEVNNPSITPFDAIYVETDNKEHSGKEVTDSMMTRALLLIAPATLELENFSLNNEKTEYESSNSISLENVTLQNNSILKLRAGQTITLNANVTINTGCRFEALTQAYCQ
ncbi:MAG: hypothetical protein ACERKD_04390 [Prolixibacteraceae bacterium]